MGVHSLWTLLAPCGRRTSVDALAQKRLAVDASIWLIQFIKAMRDERGEMLANAPLLGLFRRLVKLLALKVRPVLVFDGATPALKRRTVARRQAFRQRQEGSVRRTAEKLLLNHGTRASRVCWRCSRRCLRLLTCDGLCRLRKLRGVARRCETL